MTAGSACSANRRDAAKQNRKRFAQFGYLQLGCVCSRLPVPVAIAAALREPLGILLVLGRSRSGDYV